jgi:7-carboxy-7-deazaguanine synthase
MYFIRLAGCNLSCSYCDTPDTQNYDPQRDYTIDPLEFGHDLAHERIDDIMITGGEPLIQQREIVRLIATCRMSEEGRKVPHRFHIETNGTIYPSPYLIQQCSFIFDYKIDHPKRMVMACEDYHHLTNPCFIKFVVGKREELADAELIIQKIQAAGMYGNPRINFAIGSHDLEKISHKEIGKYIIQKQLVRTSLNVQIHKMIGMA